MVRRTYMRDPAACEKEIVILQSVAGHIPAAYAIGHTLAQLQTVAPPRALAPRRNENLNAPLLKDRIGSRQYDRLHNYMADWASRFAELCDSRSLVHGDFNNRNTLVNRIGNRWVVSGILDWECAFAGSPLWDAPSTR